jgi:Zn-finger nucleic acid-binding protein
MLCPGCRSLMQTLTLDAVLGTTAEVNACLRCRAFWFEPFETLHLTRTATLKLFQLISQNSGGTSPMPPASYCPKCHAPLVLTHDYQKTTPFQYWRCDAGHGRFTSFIDFLREKDYIRPLTPQQVAQLRQMIQMIHCSNCGAPIDLTKDSMCPHCGAPLSMLDMKKMAEMANGPATAPAEHKEIPTLVAVHGAIAPPHSQTLVDLGLDLIRQWFGDSR